MDGWPSYRDGPIRSKRDFGVLALILCFAASAWFGWAQETPSALNTWLTVAAVLGLVLAAVSALLGFRGPSGPSVMNEADRRRRYGIVVGVEFGVIGAGAAVLGATGHPELISVWVCAVVAVHFFPLAPILRDRSLVLLGGLMSVIAALGVLDAVFTVVPPSRVVGVGSGVLLLGFGVFALVVTSRFDASGRVPAG